MRQQQECLHLKGKAAAGLAKPPVRAWLAGR
jgi:hypothetical protein